MCDLKTIDIKGKDYVTVNERLKYFRCNHKDYTLTSEVLTLTGAECAIKAVIRDEKDREVATGVAYEKAGNGFINKTSHVENCETSAWGRALANFGIGIDANVASADEVANAIRQQGESKSSENNAPIRLMSKENYNELQGALQAKHGSVKSKDAITELSALCDDYGISDMKKIPDDIAVKIIADIKDKPF